MLHFGTDVRCTVFRLEHALVLHYAAAWSLVAGVAVRVLSLNPHNGEPATERAVLLDVVNGTEETRANPRGELGAYLTRNLSPEYDVRIGPAGLRVDWRGAV
jgi:hypothetical protein